MNKMSEKPSKHSEIRLYAPDRAANWLAEYNPEFQHLQTIGSNTATPWAAISNYHGWDYLTPEPIQVEWEAVCEFGDNRWKCVLASDITLKCIPVIGGKWIFKMLGVINYWDLHQTYGSLESAQIAAIEFYNNLRADMPEVRMK